MGEAAWQTAVYEIKESSDAPGEWRAEAVGPDGEVYVVIFAGPDAEARAHDYVAWMANAWELA